MKILENNSSPHMKFNENKKNKDNSEYNCPIPTTNLNHRVPKSSMKCTTRNGLSSCLFSFVCSALDWASSLTEAGEKASTIFPSVILQETFEPLAKSFLVSLAILAGTGSGLGRGVYFCLGGFFSGLLRGGLTCIYCLNVWGKVMSLSLARKFVASLSVLDE